MMWHRKLVAALVVILYVLGIGSVTAFSPQPGSADDPLITRSYVDAVLGPLSSRIMALETELVSRSAEIASLRDQLKKAEERAESLQKRIEALETNPPVAVTPAPTTPVTPVTPTPAPTLHGFINGSWVNVRSGPGTNHTVVVVLPNNTRVEVTQRGGDWHKISHNGRVGYVYAPLLRIP